jgi:hypothetical protein
MSTQAAANPAVAGQVFLSQDGQMFGPYSREQIEEMRRTGEISRYTWLWDGTTPNWVLANAAPPPPPPPGVPVAGLQAADPVQAAAQEHVEEMAELEEQSSAGAFHGPDELDAHDEPAPQASSSSIHQERTDKEIPRPALDPQPQQQALPTDRPAAVYRPEPQHAPQKQAQQPSAGASAARHPLLAICHDYRAVVNGTLSHVSAEGCVLVSSCFATTMPPFRRGSRVWLNLLDEATGRSENVEASITGFIRNGGRWEYQIQWPQFPKLLG